MPYPTPNKNESKSDYISRIMTFADSEGKDLKNPKIKKQILAIAYSMYEKFGQIKESIINKIDKIINDSTLVSDIDITPVKKRKKKEKRDESCKKDKE